MRAAETIRMALALASAGILFQLSDAVHLANMARGQDWVGIVPSDYDSYSACQLFPPEDEVRDILPYSAVAQHPGVEQRVQWYPVEPLQEVN